MRAEGMDDEKLPYGVAYLITNTVNGKKYVGISKNVQSRWRHHRRIPKRDRGLPLYIAMAKHGVENFAFDVIASAASFDDLCALEIILIAQHETFCPAGKGYNLTLGGDGQAGRIPSSETRKKMSEAQKGVPKSSDHVAKVSAANRGQKRPGQTRTEEWKQMMSDRFAGVGPSAATIAGGIAFNTGRKHSQEMRDKVSEALRKRVRKAETNDKISASLKGRTFSDETLARMREAQARRFARERAENIAKGAA